jgi:ubiquinone/menaquinone biosynthesis C-methylase UbiE
MASDETGSTRSSNEDVSDVTSARVSQAAGVMLARYYQSRFRYSDTAIRSCMRYAAQYIAGSATKVLDVGCGTGEPERYLVEANSHLDIIGLDISLPMIDASDPVHRVWRAACAGLAEQLPVRDDVMSVVLTISAFHLWDHYRFLTEVSRVLVSGGLMVLVVVEPADLETQVFHRYFPEFATVEAARHRSIAEISYEALPHGLSFVASDRYPFSVWFESKNELVDFVSSRPFFGMHYLTDAEFKQGLHAFRDRVMGLDDSAGVTSPSALTVGVWRKELLVKKHR